MTLQSSGPISLLDVQNEFGGSNPIGINEYYGFAAGVPSSGTISLNDFYGKSASPPFSWTPYVMGGRGVYGNYSVDYFDGIIITPGAASSPVTFVIYTSIYIASPYSASLELKLYIGGSLVSTYTGNNTAVYRVTAFGSSSLQWRSILNTGAGQNNSVSAYVYHNSPSGNVLYEHFATYNVGDD